ncbi:MAG: UDP-N-acetylmuramate dehydrogenase [Clostridiales bacterium]|nr:UDP-N-acetylmuramate dehydrogenase [Clostridiales bacterium]
MKYARLSNLFTSQGIKCAEGLPLAGYTSFRIGGAAELVVFPKNADEAVFVLNEIRSERYIVLGNGSNVLIDDNGFDGVVIILSEMREFEVSGDSLTLTSEAGFPLTKLASSAAKLSLTGLEFAYGIPGTVGGGVFMNAGAYGGEMSNVVVSSRWFDTDTGEIGAYTGGEHEFAYRHSAYMEGNRIILSVDCHLQHGDKAEIEAKMNDYMSRRRDKQPLDLPSAGSVFKRGDGFITAQLIEAAGLKGRSVGGAEVSEKHAGFIVNRSGATSCDVLDLIDIVKETIFEKFGKTIECEVRYIPRS